MNRAEDAEQAARSSRCPSDSLGMENTGFGNGNTFPMAISKRHGLECPSYQRPEEKSRAIYRFDLRYLKFQQKRAQHALCRVEYGQPFKNRKGTAATHLRT